MCTPLIVVCGAITVFFSRTSSGSMPSSSAIMSIRISAANRVWVEPWPRIAAPGGWFVNTRQTSYLKCGILYGSVVSTPLRYSVSGPITV